MEEPNDGLHEKQKHGRRYGRRYTFLAFGSGWTALGCIDPIHIFNINSNMVKIILHIFKRCTSSNRILFMIYVQASIIKDAIMKAGDIKVMCFLDI